MLIVGTVDVEILEIWIAVDVIADGVTDKVFLGGCIL